MENILLTGGFGFTGSHLINKLQKIGFTPIIYSRNNQPNKIIENKNNLVFEKGDITDFEKLWQVIQKHKPIAILHLAALTGITKCEKEPQNSFLINVYGTFNVIMACIKTKTRLIFLSSREVYGETENTVTSEDDPLLPNNVYGITKLEGENLVLWANKKFGLDYTILRPTNIYGYGGDQYGAQVLIKKLLDDLPIQIFGGNQKMNFVFIEDVVDAIIKTISDKRANNQILNVGSNDNLTINEFLDRLTKIMGKKPKVEYQPMRQGETQKFNVSIKRIENVLGWYPKTDIANGLLKTIKWYKENNHPRLT